MSNIDQENPEKSGESNSAADQKGAEAQAMAEQEAKEKAEAEAKAKAEQEAKEKAEAGAKAKAEQEAKEKAEAEAKAKAEQEAKKKEKKSRKLKDEFKVIQTFKGSPTGAKVFEYEEGTTVTRKDLGDDLIEVARNEKWIK